MLSERGPTCNQATTNSDELYPVNSLTDQIAIVFIAVCLGAMSVWMWWIVQTFLDGNTWGDFLVRIVLHDFIFAIGLFAAAMLINGLFSPIWFAKILETATQKTVSAVMVVTGLFTITTVFFLLVLPILLHFGIVR